VIVVDWLNAIRCEAPVASRMMGTEIKKKLAERIKSSFGE
jgi:hypothetical protein